MEVFIIEFLHAGFVVLLHSAGTVARNGHSSSGNLIGNVFPWVKRESMLLFYESLSDLN